MPSKTPFKISPYTGSSERQRSVIRFSGLTAESVFQIMGDADRITDWFILAKQVKHYPPSEAGEAKFSVEFTLFGDVFEEVLEWDPPRRYAYKASGPEFPIKDYSAEIEVRMTSVDEGEVVWSMYFDQIEGMEFQRLIPVILPPIVNASVQNLAKILNGTVVECLSNYEQFAEA